jgi:hypothetical protein
MRVIYTLFFLLSCGLIFLAASGGPAEVQGADRTGGPLSTSGEGSYCQMCHGAGAFNPSMTVEMLDGSTPITGYTPGQTYTMRVTVNADAGAQVYGFQAVALNGADNDQAGSFTATAGNQVTPLNGRQYIEHSQRSQSNIFEVQWTAPASGIGDVRIYSASVAANNAAGSGGDGSARLNDPLVLSDITSTRDLPALATRLNAFPNPVVDQLNLQVDITERSDASLRIVNMLGQPVLQQTITLDPGTNNLSYDLSNLVAGQYFIDISNQEAASRAVIFKR